MKCLIIFLFLIFNFSLAKGMDYQIFLIPLNQCKSLNVDMFVNSNMYEENEQVTTLVCTHNHHFLSCTNSSQTKMTFNLVQNFNGNQFVFMSKSGAKLLLDSSASVSVFSQSFISGRSTFSSEICTGLFFKNLNPEKIYSLNNGLKNLLEKVVGVPNEK